ncbi:FG-GAP repeat domain-containing protein [Streptomyces griseofuscus]|uniref:FG-GAP repeat domain-containing protein n=1 Tax=Streptomyces griseofuscus TaxID=146922 RepID=UPI0036C47BBB
MGFAVLATAAVLGVMSPVASAEPVPAADEVVLAPYGKSVLPEYLYSAGQTGFLHRAYGRGWQWTDYTTGESTTPDIPADGSAGRIFDTHADTIAYQTGTNGVVLIDPADGAKRTLRLPEGFALRSVQGDTVLGYANGECHLFRLTSDGSLDDRPVTGVPSGATCGMSYLPDAGDGNGVVVRYRSATGDGLGLVDLSTARMSVLPVPQSSMMSLQITPQAIAWYDSSAGAEQVVPRDNPRATPWSVPNPSAPISSVFRLVGSRVLRMTTDQDLTVSVVSSDGVVTKPLDHGGDASANFVPGPGGDLLVSGVLNGEHGVHRFSESPDGDLRRSGVLDIPWVPSRTGSLALFQGRLDTADTYTGNLTAYHERKLVVSGTPAVVKKENLGTADLCGVSGCPLYPTGDGRVLYPAVAEGKAVLRLVDGTHPTPGTAIATGLTDLTVESVSGRYVAYRTATATVVRDLDSGAVVRTVSAAPGALWGATLWQAAGAGKITASDVRTGTVSRTLSVGASCTPSSVQATGRYVYAECGDGGGTAVLVSLADGKARALPTGSAPGLLGDGFVVRVGADRQVTLTDVTSTTPATRVLGTARGTTAGTDWTVDAYGGQLAYVDADENVHVVPTGIAAGALGVTDSSVPASAHVALDGPAWKPRWWISKPVSTWQLTIKNRTTGKTVRTLTDGETRGQITPSWDGSTDVGGVGAPDATYAWTLTAWPTDGQGPEVTKSGTVKITGGQTAYHDFVARDRGGDLLTINSAGAFTFQQSTGTGTFSGKTSASGWPTSAVAVAFGTGDDQCNNVLVRLGSGELRGYRPGCGALKPSTPYTSLGTGWNAYDNLTAPGDLTGDSRPDLLARKKSTGDIYLFAARSDGSLAAGKKIRTAWTGYTRIVGAGDLDGDGYGDVLARDKAGTLYRYNGTGTGLLKDRVKVFSNWGDSYNAIVGVGDINGDGKNDLVERDTAGNLYRNSGDGKGSFGARVKIATGWQGYQGIF